MNGWGGDPAEIVCASVSIPGELLRLVVPPAPAWHALAQCRDHPTDLWFPNRGQDPEEAKMICAGCPVRVECLDEAIADPSLDHGIRGGVAPEARKRMRTARRRAADAAAEGGPNLHDDHPGRNTPPTPARVYEMGFSELDAAADASCDRSGL